MTAPITHRPLQKGPRQNAAGLWRCGYDRGGGYGCGGYFPRDAFWTRADGTPIAWCKECARARDRMRFARRAVDDAWWARELERTRAYNQPISRERESRRRERAAMAEQMLRNLRGKGLTPRNVEQVTGISEDSLRAMRRRGTLRHGHVLDGLVLLHQVCENFPPLERTQGSPPHPYLAEITYRYRAAREAQA